MDNMVVNYNIEEMIKATNSMENVSVGGSKCYDFGDKVLVKYVLPTQYGKAREDAEKVKETLDKLKDSGVPNICRHLAIKREVVGDKSYCWVLQEKAKGIPCSEFYKMTSDKDKIIAMIADYPGFKYFGENKHIVHGAPYNQIKDLLISTYEMINAGLSLEPKAKNVFYDEETGFTHIDFLVNDKYYKDLLPWEKCAYVFDYAKLAMLQSLPRFVSPKVSDKMVSDLRKCAVEVIPEYKKYKRWLEKDLNYINATEKPIDINAYEEYINGLKMMYKAEVEKNVKLVKEGKKEIINVHPSNILKQNIEFFNIKSFDNNKEYEDEFDIKYAKERAFEKEMQDEIEKQLKYEQNNDLAQ